MCGPTAANVLTMAVLLPSKEEWPDFRASIGALALAAKVASSSDLLRGTTLEYVWREVDCDSSMNVAALSEMIEEGPVDVVIGPACDDACESTALLTGVFILATSA